jgi:uncharacterized membrane protein YqjE
LIGVNRQAPSLHYFALLQGDSDDKAPGDFGREILSCRSFVHETTLAQSLLGFLLLHLPLLVFQLLDPGYLQRLDLPLVGFLLLLHLPLLVFQLLDPGYLQRLHLPLVGFLLFMTQSLLGFLLLHLPLLVFQLLDPGYLQRLDLPLVGFLLLLHRKRVVTRSSSRVAWALLGPGGIHAMAVVLDVRRVTTAVQLPRVCRTAWAAPPCTIVVVSHPTARVPLPRAKKTSRAAHAVTAPTPRTPETAMVGYSQARAQEYAVAPPRQALPC